MFTSKSQPHKIWRRLTSVLVPGLLTLGLVSYTAEATKTTTQAVNKTLITNGNTTISNSNQAELSELQVSKLNATLLPISPSLVAQASNKNRQGIKTNVLRMGYQQAGDLVRITGVLEKRLEPLGVKVEWAQFAQGPQLMEAMNVGRIDLGSVGETPPIFAQAAGAPIVYVVGSQRTANSGKGSAIAVPPDSPIKSVRDLKGKTVVFQRGSASHYFILRALEEVGLKPNDIKIQSIPNVEASSAFLEGKIPVWVTGDPHLARAEKLGKVRIIRNAQGLDTPGSYYVGLRKFAIDNPTLLRIVIEEIDKIQRWAQANPKETAKLVGQHQKLPPDVMDLVLSRRSYGLRAITPELIREQQRIADYFHKNGVIPKRINIQEATLTQQQYATITPPSISRR